MGCFSAEDDVARRKELTPKIRNEIVRDLAATMFAYMQKPDKDFCTRVAKMLTDKYRFLRDVGSTNSGYVCIHLYVMCICGLYYLIDVSPLQGSWEKKLLECVNNKKKIPKRKLEKVDGESCMSPAKRGRPKSDPSLARYPPLVQADEDTVAEEALKLEVQKERPRKEIIVPLMKKTFPSRRHYILTCAKSVHEILEMHKELKLPFAVSSKNFFLCSLFILLFNTYSLNKRLILCWRKKMWSKML